MPYNNDFRKIIESLAQRRSSAPTVFADFCKMSACALAMGSRDAEYLEIAQRFSRDELSDISLALALLVQEMERKPFSDVLGPYYMEIAPHSSQKARGEFYTPPEICRLMARMTFSDDSVGDGKPITLNEPACGSGGTILAVAEMFAPSKSVDRLRVTAQDINPVAIDMTYINLTLWGIPSQVILGDTLRMTVTASWKNVHWFRVGEEQRRQIERVMELVEGRVEPSPVVVSGEAVQVSQAKSQLLFDF